MIEQLPSSRRAFIRNTALASGGTAVAFLLSACGAETDNGSSAGSSTESDAVQEPVTVPAAEVPVGGGAVFKQHEIVVTQPTEGSYFAFSAICTHQGCVLVSVEDRGAFCGCHSSYFDINTGDPVAGPAQEPLPSIPVAVSGDTLTVG
ncbi:MAG: ubiquinol-cytochrome c reductase iron-sulfur subunit [Gulosibacter sp.]|uniref:QcrA and Rieske domain-containing protein n=1 Tax=Gulosibacter sp. TaxID=2817531 RepID=UPI003F914B45